MEKDSPPEVAGQDCMQILLYLLIAPLQRIYITLIFSEIFIAKTPCFYGDRITLNRTYILSIILCHLCNTARQICGYVTMMSVWRWILRPRHVCWIARSLQLDCALVHC